MKFLKILGLTLAICLFIGVGLRLHGLNQTPANFEHDFLKQDFKLMALGGDSRTAPSHSIEAFRAALKLRPQIVLAMNTYMSSDERFFVAAKQEEVAPFTSAQLETQGVKSLHDVLASFPETRFVVIAHDNVRDMHLKFVDGLKDLELDKRLLVHSKYDVILQGIKSLKPQWIYGTGFGDITRLVSMTSIWLGPIVQMNGDVYISPVTYRNRSLMNEALMSELKRRQKHVIVFITDPEKDFVTAKLWEVDAYLTDQPHLALPFLE